MMSRQNFIRLTAAAGLFCAGTVAQAEPAAPSYNLYGLPGLVDMPTADQAPDATLTTTIGRIGDTTRTTLTFRITPRLTGSFRYSAISHFNNPDSVNGVYYDRSFDLRYRILTESKYRPNVTVGLQDMMGTGLLSGEYIVATKGLMDGRLRVTGGLGWGRLGRVGSFASTGTRPTTTLGRGGIPTFDRWFRGPVSAFGGLSYAINDRLQVSAEYSSDNYSLEERNGRFSYDSPWNYGLTYRTKNGTQLSLYHAYGSQFGFLVSFHNNLRRAPTPGGSESAPVPVRVRAPGSAADLGWTDVPDAREQVSAALTKGLKRERLGFEGLTLSAHRATLRLANGTYGATPQAMGRAARVMSRYLPASIEEFVIVPMVNGVPASAVVMKRSDIENLEHGAASDMRARTQVIDGYGLAPDYTATDTQRFVWSLAPYLKLSVFDPDNPVRADIGLRAQAQYNFTPNLVLSGAITKKLGGNLDSIIRDDPSGLPRVRTDYAHYSREGDPAIEHLTLTHFGRPGRDLYSRVSLGYLETMYAGVSGEVLWKPVDSRLALGAELNYVRQRDYDQLFGLRDYSAVTGHASAYYSFGNGFHGQLDVGQYLAGDIGATVSIDREFANGWRVGAYATFTNVSAEDFGEGSFDKGIRITVPVSSIIGSPSRRSNTVVVQSLTRDGGARLNVNNRLYEQIRGYHGPEVDNTWGRFWR